jgi:hypothetical protein
MRKEKLSLRPNGVTHIDIPITPSKVWHILRDKGVIKGVEMA